MEIIDRAYAAFNARDIDAVLALMTPDVEWPRAWKGGYVRGHDAIRAYWQEQWAEINPHVEPESIVEDADGRIVVRVHTTVRNLEGAVVFDGYVSHTYTLRDGLIVRMDVMEDAI